MLPLAKIKRLIEKNRWAQAQESLQQRLKAYPEELQTLNWLAMCALQKKHYTQAQAWCHRSLTLKPEQPRLWSQAAEIALRREDYPLAFEAITRAVGQMPDDTKFLCLQAQVLMKVHRWPQAAKLLDKLMAKEPNNPNIKMLQLQRLQQEERFEEAEPIAREFFEASRTPDVTNTYAVTLLNLGRAEEAVELLRRGVNYYLSNPINAIEQPEPSGYMNVDKAREALLALHEVMGRLNVPFFLFAGTLLGIVRDGEQLPHDKDMDVGLPWKTPRLPLLEALLNQGFVCPQIDSYRKKEPDWYLTVLHKETGITIDFFFAKVVENEGEDTKGKVLMGFEKGGQPMLWGFRPFKLTSIDYHGKSFLAPDPPEQPLEDSYGENWRIPDANFDACIVSPNVTPESRPVGQAMGLNRLLGHLGNQNWKKAHGYCLQLLSIAPEPDPMLEKLRDLLEKKFGQPDWYKPIS